MSGVDDDAMAETQAISADEAPATVPTLDLRFDAYDLLATAADEAKVLLDLVFRSAGLAEHLDASDRQMVERSLGELRRLYERANDEAIRLAVAMSANPRAGT